MNFLPKSIQAKLREKYSPNTVINHAYGIYRIMRELYNAEVYKAEYITNVKKVFKYIDNLPKTSHKTNYLNIIKNVAKADKDIDEKVAEVYGIKLGEYFQKKKVEAVKNIDEEDNCNDIITMDEVRTARERYKKGTRNYRNDMTYLLLCFYSYIQPMRISELLDLKYNLLEDEDLIFNHCDIKKKELVMNYHKTIDSKGVKRVKIPNELLEVIKEMKEKYPSSYVFTNKELKDNITRQVARDMLMKAFGGKKVSCQMLRQVYNSSRTQKGRTSREREEDARVMGHSLATQALHYNRIPAPKYTSDVFTQTHEAWTSSKDNNEIEEGDYMSYIDELSEIIDSLILTINTMASNSNRTHALEVW